MIDNFVMSYYNCSPHSELKQIHSFKKCSLTPTAKSNIDRIVQIGNIKIKKYVLYFSVRELSAIDPQFYCG